MTDVSDYAPADPPRRREELRAIRSITDPTQIAVPSTARLGLFLVLRIYGYTPPACPPERGSAMAARSDTAAF